MEFEIKARTNTDLGIKELINYNELFYFFTWRDIKVKYKQTILGFAWAVLQPLLMTIVFSVFFGKALKVPSGDLPYPVFVMAGLLLWNIFASGLSAAANSMVSNANIIKKIYFPRLIIPLSSILVSLFDFLMALIVFIGLLFWYAIKVNILYFILAATGGMILTAFATFGPGCLLAALNIKYRDFRYVIPFLIQLLLFVTPVIYPIKMLDDSIFKFILSLNPLAGAIELFRSSITGVAPDYQLLGLSFVVSLAMMVIGIFYFRRTESYFADLA
jgi:lipopolysaccharide transport system permease protein